MHFLILIPYTTRSQYTVDNVTYDESSLHQRRCR